ncbi:uncharacterized protein LOC128388959 isoform X2 [Panonychus citri]|uniref:uncharacterized protein LOC128388959 isoform X2 n=1 Tax=Panonychus citri TaxID=50023 RepID=UPI00230776A1|nr:uncharacterized protein LOC128388959 isoform X2 [Panonychus citri]
MSLNDLPDICLWKIFENVHEAKELIRLSKVCSRWSDLITPRFNRVKYLQMIYITKPCKYGEKKVDYIDANSLWMNEYTNWNDYNLFQLFPNLKIIDASALLGSSSYNSPEIVKNNPQIKGLVIWDDFENSYDFANIEMFAAVFDFDYKKVFRPDQLKQVYCDFLDMNDVPSFIEYFPNLKRLHIKPDKANGVFYNGPNLSSLKILEFVVGQFVEQFTGFHFMDFCPSLESVFFTCWAKDLYVNESIKNYNLRDLVVGSIPSRSYPWPLFKKLLSKFPNLHHLAIRHFFKFDDSSLRELINLLPELKILDLRVFSRKVYKKAEKAFLSKYCVKENRSIVIYYNCENEPTEWPKLVDTYEPICYGFDFMKHCFYKQFSYLPNLIDE